MTFAGNVVCLPSRALNGAMAKASTNEPLEPLIFTIRGQRVVLDADLARLYGVDTKRFNEAFKRNRHRFPRDFAFQLANEEFRTIRSQFVTGSTQDPDSPKEKMMWSQFATTSSKRRRDTYRPWAFSEHGALMAANIQKLLPLLQPVTTPPKRRIGFQ